MAEEDINYMISKVEEHKGRISYKATSSGEIPYEMNITWWSALNSEPDIENPVNLKMQIKRYLNSRAIALCLKGVPGIYIHGLLATPNHYLHLDRAMGGENRNINRKNLFIEDVLEELEGEDDNSHTKVVFEGLLHLLAQRRKEKAFNPYAKQIIIKTKKEIIGILRMDSHTNSNILCLFNITQENQEVSLKELGTEDDKFYNILEETQVTLDNVALGPYDFVWLRY